ncbi:MAG: helix-turn-helix transcriptional regulator, partial [Syntrophaceae bacterium]
LDEINTALNFLQGQMKKEKADSEARMINNVKELVFPYIEKLKITKLDDQQREYVSVIENNLENIMSPFLGNLPSAYSRLTPMEMQIANLIKDGKTSKEISSLLNLSTTTIDFHRNNIRSKLNLKNKDVGLRAHLLTLSKPE